MKGALVALVIVAVVGVAVVVFFIMGRRAPPPPDPLTVGVGNLTGGVATGISAVGKAYGGAVTTVVNTAGNIAKIPIRVANDAISLVEAPFKAAAKILHGLW